MISSWEDIMSAMDAVKKVVQGLMDFMQNYSQNKKAMDLQVIRKVFKNPAQVHDICFNLLFVHNACHY